MTHKTKPATVSAFKLGTDPIPDWFRALVNSGAALVDVTYVDTIRYAYIDTGRYRTVANKGDYVVRDSNWRIYAVDAEIFETLFERMRVG